jgi:hypothetical protein
VNLDSSGNPDPSFVTIDWSTARHPQTRLATHFGGQPLTVDHGAPLRLFALVGEQQKPGGLSCKLLQKAAKPPKVFAQGEASAAQSPVFFGSIFELIQLRRHRISRLGSTLPGLALVQI